MYIYECTYIDLKHKPLHWKLPGLLQLSIVMNDHQEEAKETIASTPAMIHHQPPSISRYKWWLRVTILTIFVLSGQAISTLLLQLYFEKGGNSKWMSTLVQTAGFPVLVPLIFFFPTQNQAPRKISLIVGVYIFLGILFASNCTFNSVGISNLPVSTFSLISASQLGFTAFFSYFLNTQKFSPLIINSLVLLTMSSTLLVFQQEGSSKNISKTKYAIGFVCTVCGAASAGLFYNVSQFAFRRLLKSTAFRVVLDLLIYESCAATILIGIGVFASGEWKNLKEEMEGYELGRGLYVITLVGIGMSIQVNLIGLIGLVFEVSSLFSNVIGALGVPIVPIFAVIFFHESMSGVKVMAMLLALWGFVSYTYQEYVDDSKTQHLI